MSEDDTKYNETSPEGELKFVRLKNTCEDLVGYVTYHNDYLTVEMPLRIEIETIFDEGRQILSLQEYLPQSIVEIRQVDINLNDIMFCTPIKNEFYEQYEYCRDFFYENNSKLKIPKVVGQKIEHPEEIAEATKKVVSILEAMANKKDKPVH
jgi:hypothetical protein